MGQSGSSGFASTKDWASFISGCSRLVGKQGAATGPDNCLLNKPPWPAGPQDKIMSVHQLYLGYMALVARCSTFNREHYYMYSLYIACMHKWLMSKHEDIATNVAIKQTHNYYVKITYY